MLLSELQKTDLIKYDTDKLGNRSSWTRSQNNPHSYAKFYDSFFAKRKNDELKILEVGIKYGGSVRLLHDYLVNSHIVGVDISNQWRDRGNYDRLMTYYFDAYNKKNWNKLPYKRFDIIIDDGSHTLQSQIFVIKNFKELLRWGGTLIIEDVHKDNLQQVLSYCPFDNLRVYDWSDNRIDDILIVCHK